MPLKAVCMSIPSDDFTNTRQRRFRTPGSVYELRKSHLFVRVLVVLVVCSTLDWQQICCTHTKWDEKEAVFPSVHVCVSVWREIFTKTAWSNFPSSAYIQNGNGGSVAFHKWLLDVNCQSFRGIACSCRVSSLWFVLISLRCQMEWERNDKCVDVRAVSSVWWDPKVPVWTR